MDIFYDCVVVGGGAAGLSAALVLGRACRRVLVVDGGKPRNASASHSHSFFTRDGINPLELLQIGRDQLAVYPEVELLSGQVDHVDGEDGNFLMTLSTGRVVAGRKVILATGVVDELPPVEGLRKLWGDSVFHCPYCHGWELRGQRIAILANSSVAVQAVVKLRGWTHQVVICTDGLAQFTEDEQELLAKHQVMLREEKVLRAIGCDGTLERIEFETGEPLLCAGIFVVPKRHFHSNLAADLGCESTESGLVKTDEFGQTTVRGVYAAGDMMYPAQQIAFAVARGAMAAVMANQSLLDAEFFGLSETV